MENKKLYSAMLGAVKMPKKQEAVRPFYNKLGFHNGRITSTNGIIMLEVRQPYPEEYEGMAVDGKGNVCGNPQDFASHFRSREMIMDMPSHEMGRISGDEVSNFLKAYKSMEHEENACVFLFGRNINLNVLYDALNAAAKITKDGFTAYTKSDKNMSWSYEMLRLDSDHGSIRCAVMPTMPPSDGDEWKTYRFEDLSKKA